MVVLLAPLGPTSAVSDPAAAVKEILQGRFARLIGEIYIFKDDILTVSTAWQGQRRIHNQRVHIEIVKNPFKQRHRPVHIHIQIGHLHHRPV